MIFVVCSKTVGAPLAPTTVATFTPGYYAPGETVLFDASNSHDNDLIDGGVALKWEWNFNYNGSFYSGSIYTTTSPYVTPSFPGDGIYQVAVRFWDNDGQAGNVVVMTVTIGLGPTYYYLKDHLGSVRATIDEKGNRVGYDDYYPFGEIMPGRSSNSAIADAKYKYTGKERDVETGLDYFGARYYDSWRGQWTSVDPMAEKYPGWSPFSYSADNPVELVDVDGARWLPAAEYALEYLRGLDYKPGLQYIDLNTNWNVLNDNSAECNEIIARAYRGDESHRGWADFAGPMKSQVDWFQNHGWFFSDGAKARSVADVGDALYYGDIHDKDPHGHRHAAIIVAVTVQNGVKKYRILYARHQGKESIVSHFLTFDALENYFGTNLPFEGLGSVQQSDARDLGLFGEQQDKYDASHGSPQNSKTAPDATSTIDAWYNYYFGH